MNLRISVALVALVTAAASPAWAGTEFLSYEGRDAIHEGQGGEKKVVNGVDFWMSGDPPHRYQVLGSIADRRHETGLIGMVRMSSLDADIAKEAKVAGGDAVILTSESEEFLGRMDTSNTSINGNVAANSFSANATSTSFGRAIKNHLARYVVVRYLDMAGPGAPPIPSPNLAPPQP